MVTRWIRRMVGRNKNRRNAASFAERVGFGGRASTLSSVVGAVDDLRAELSRARRYEHELSIVVLSPMPLPPPRSASSEGPAPESRTLETAIPQLVLFLAAATLRETLRESDVLCHQLAENRFVLALTESGPEETRAAVRRIRAVARNQLRLDLRAGTARFPVDGLTLEGLVERAAARLGRRVDRIVERQGPRPHTSRARPSPSTPAARPEAGAPSEAPRGSAAEAAIRSAKRTVARLAEGAD